MKKLKLSSFILILIGIAILIISALYPYLFRDQFTGGYLAILIGYPLIIVGIVLFIISFFKSRKSK